MPCERHEFGDGITVIVCSRRPAQPCSVPGCQRRYEKLCDYPVTRNGQAATCDANLCAKCAVPQKGPDRDFCPAHAKLAARKAP